MSSIQYINGVIPALVTPFNEREDLDEGRLRTLVEHLIGSGIHGLYLTGSTGEGFLMTSDERKRVLEIVVDQNAGRVPIISHIGAIGTRKSIELAKHAENLKVDAISSVPPFYWKFDGESIYRYYRDITGATGLPMIVYNIALAALVDFDQILRLASIRGVEGIKYTATTHLDIMRIKEEIGEDFKVYSGADEMALSGLSFGADGIIGSFYNLMPELFVELYDAVRDSDLATAREKQRIANLVITFSTRYQYVSVIKQALNWVGADGGWCREPFISYTPKEMANIKNEFRRIRDKHDIQDVAFLNALG